MNKQLVAVAASLAFAMGAHAAGEQGAWRGIAADALSTGAALSMPGVVEANPLGWATLPIRMGIVEHARSLPREEGQPVVDAVSAGSWGATANNLLVLAGASSAAPVVGLAVGYVVWKAGETEREFWRMCAVHQKLDAGVKCEFRAWKPEEVVHAAQERDAQRVAGAATDKPLMAPLAR